MNCTVPGFSQASVNQSTNIQHLKHLIDTEIMASTPEKDLPQMDVESKDVEPNPTAQTADTIVAIILSMQTLGLEFLLSPEFQTGWQSENGI